MTSHDRVNQLFEDLASLGIDQAFVRRMMPEWWDDAAADSPGAVAELKVALARRFRLDPKDLFSRDPRARLLPVERVKFKRRLGRSEVHPSVATAIASAVAEIVAEGTRVPFRPLPSDPNVLRRNILDMGPRWIGLGELMHAAWALHGIPVIRLVDLPENPHIDGILVNTRERPVVVILKRTPIAAWILFILAHELGHAALGHLGSDSMMLIDEDTGDDTLVSPSSNSDAEERTANEYAFRVLNGDVSGYAPAPGSTVNAPALAMAAWEQGLRLKVDPGHIILRYGYENSAWPLAISAIRNIDYGDIVRRSFAGALNNLFDPGAVSEDSADFLRRITTA